MFFKILLKALISRVMCVILKMLQHFYLD